MRIEAKIAAGLPTCSTGAKDSVGLCVREGYSQDNGCARLEVRAAVLLGWYLWWALIANISLFLRLILGDI